MSNDYVNDANSQMDDLIKNDVFGVKSKEILQLNQEGNFDEFYYESIKSIVDVYKRKNNMSDFIDYLNSFIEIFNNAIRKNAHECKDIIDSTFLRTKKDPSLELSSSYDDYIELENELNDSYKEFKLNDNMKTRRKYARLCSRTYASSYEFTVKLSTFVIALIHLSRDEKYNLSKIHKSFGQQKINMFSKILDDDKNILNYVWNTKIRNSINHGELYYNFKDDLFHGKYKYSKNGVQHVENFTITFDELNNELFKTRLFFHCYVVSSELFALRHLNSELFKKIMNYINN